MLWLGDRLGYLPDAVTQLWVRAGGSRFDPLGTPWLDGPIGDTQRIGVDFFERVASREGMAVREGSGLLADVSVLQSSDVPREIDGAVADFYQNTASYHIDAWSDWDGLLKPFGTLLAKIFSRRLQQLNLPLDNLETSRGMTSRILETLDADGRVKHIAWIRTLIGSGRTIYCGSYSTCVVPGFNGTCLRVSFPLPNGNATVVLAPEVQTDGSLVLRSSGERFGDPGFYFVLHRRGNAYARYVPAMRERIHVYHSDANEVRTDHQLWFMGRRFLQLHYRLRRTQQ